MDTILKNPGLQHIAEDIFLNLGENSINKCANVNQIAMELVNRPMFWFKKLSQVKLFSKYIEPWRELICKLNTHYALDHNNIEQALTMKLKEMYGQCWNISPLKLALQMGYAKENYGLIKFILENVDPKSGVSVCWEWSLKCRSDFLWHSDYFSAIHIATYFGYIDVVMNLIQKYDMKLDDCLIHLAAWYGYTEIFKILVDKLTNSNRLTPIELATRSEHLGIIDIITQMNSKEYIYSGDTLVHYAALGGHIEIVEFFKRFTDNLNVPNKNGYTPSDYAKLKGHLNLAYFLETGTHPKPNLLKRIYNSLINYWW